MKKHAIALSSALIFIFLAALAPAFADCCNKDGMVCAASEKGTCPPAKASSKEPTEQDVVIDPVCGMDVTAATAKYNYKYKGKTYYFCSKSCYNNFKKDPSKYIGKERK